MLKMKWVQFLLIFILIISAAGIEAQNSSDSSWTKKIENWRIQPVIGLQIWSSYTFDAEAYNEETGEYEAADNRINSQIRRTRLGLKGQPFTHLKFAVVTSLDLVGRDLLAGTEGGANNGGSPNFRIWNAYLQWKVSGQYDGLHLTVGYIVPQIGRESITSALRVSSMEKSWSQNYIRRHLTGTGPGRTVGLNIGGMFHSNSQNVKWSYNVGIFTPTFHALDGNSTGLKSSPLFTGRMAVHFGDPEFEDYTLSHKVNYFGKRKGLTIAIAGAQQGRTDLFTENKAYGMDWLFNWDDWNISGEWIVLQRSGEEMQGDQVIRKIDSDSHTGFVRIGRNISLKNRKVLEPVLTFVQFSGTLDASEQKDANTLNAFTGKDQYVEASLNYYINPKLKLSLGITLRSGEAGEIDQGTTFNNYYYQSGVGAIHRGHWLGVGVVAIF